jgi:RND family efflux transporter MFP subunit
MTEPTKEPRGGWVGKILSSWPAAGWESRLPVRELRERIAATRLAAGWRRLAPGVRIALAAASALALFAVLGLWIAGGGDGPGGDVTVTVRRADLVVDVSAGGELESVSSVDIRCQVEGFQPKIIEVLPEGSQVTAGQVIARLDAGDIKRALVEQEIKVKRAEALAAAAQEEFEIQKNMAESKVAQAELALKLAQLDREKYLKGESKVEVNDLNGSIALAEAELQDARDTVEYYRRLVKKGFRTPEQLRAKEQAVKRFQFYLDRDKEKLQVLQKFTSERTLVELTAKAEESVRELERSRRSGEAEVAKAKTDAEATEITARLEKSQYEKLEKQLEACDVRAPQDGVLIYASSKGQRITLGASVIKEQKLFSLPDLERLQARAYVHESVVKNIRRGLKAEVRADALHGAVLVGTVEGIANFHDAERHWMMGGVKEYATTVGFTTVSGEGLKPGMTVEVKVLVDELPDVLLIPVAAVLERGGRHFCLVPGLTGFREREVSLGQSNASFVEVKAGLEEGEEVLLNPRRQLITRDRDGAAASDGT